MPAVREEAVGLPVREAKPVTHALTLILLFAAVLLVLRVYGLLEYRRGVRAERARFTGSADPAPGLLESIRDGFDAGPEPIEESRPARVPPRRMAFKADRTPE